MSCQLKILNLVKPLVEVIHGLPNPPAQALQEFSKAAEALAPCLLISTPAGILPFLHGLLCLEISSLHCLLTNLQVVANLERDSPSAVAVADLGAVLDSYAPIIGTLELAGELFQMGGLTIPKAPALAAGTDLDSLIADQNTVAAFIASLEDVSNALGGCR
jgi:hypothetical protein